MLLNVLIRLLSPWSVAGVPGRSSEANAPPGGVDGAPERPDKTAEPSGVWLVSLGVMVKLRLPLLV